MFWSCLITALCYKPEGRKLAPMRQMILSIYLILPVALAPGVHSASNRNEYQQQKKCFWGVEPVRKAAICEPIV
jgi:hypothetical protein